MGRESRQSRRARERREQERRKQGSQGGARSIGSGSGNRGSGSGGAKWSLFVIAAVLLVAVAAGGFMLYNSTQAKSSNQAAAIATDTPGKTIDTIGCNYMEQGHYHVHAHLTILNHGQQVTIPAGIGINIDHDCLYWLHTHNPDGVIHIESPKVIRPKLGYFFDIWGKPLNSNQVGPVKVQPGEQVKVFVDKKPYTGNPANITLVRHTTVTIEVGAPFSPPKGFNFAAYNL